jgi:DNA-binding HxlR family transcriptional regulator
MAQPVHDLYRQWHPGFVGASYRQLCPVAKAMELLDERWTMLIVRELVCGSEHFNEIRRGVPRISPAVLAKRLHPLARAGILTRVEHGSEVRYLHYRCRPRTSVGCSRLALRCRSVRAALPNHADLG